MCEGGRVIDTFTIVYDMVYHFRYGVLYILWKCNINRIVFHHNNIRIYYLDRQYVSFGYKYKCHLQLPPTLARICYVHVMLIKKKSRERGYLPHASNRYSYDFHKTEPIKWKQKMNVITNNVITWHLFLIKIDSNCFGISGQRGFVCATILLGLQCSKLTDLLSVIRDW